MILENKINVVWYLFHHDLNTAEPKIYGILPSTPQTQCPIAYISLINIKT